MMMVSVQRFSLVTLTWFQFLEFPFELRYEKMMMNASFGKVLIQFCTAEGYEKFVFMYFVMLCITKQKKLGQFE